MHLLTVTAFLILLASRDSLRRVLARSVPKLRLLRVSKLNFINISEFIHISIFPSTFPASHYHLTLYYNLLFSINLFCPRFLSYLSATGHFSLDGSCINIRLLFASESFSVYYRIHLFLIEHFSSLIDDLRSALEGDRKGSVKERLHFRVNLLSHFPFSYALCP